MQGHLRSEPVSVFVDSRCEHCDEPLTLEVDTHMNVRVSQQGAAPLVFTPDVDLFDVGKPTIVDDF